MSTIESRHASVAARLQKTQNFRDFLEASATTAFSERTKVRLCRKEARLSMRLADLDYELELKKRTEMKPTN